MGSLLNEQMSRVNRRIAYLKERRQILKNSLPVLEADRDWADKNASAQTWYFANVKVNNTNREIRHIEQELSDLNAEKGRLKVRMELRKD